MAATVKRGLALIADQIRDAAEELRAKEAATLDALHEAYLPAALHGDVKAAEIVLKVRRDYRELNDLDLQRPPDDSGREMVVYTGLPPEFAAMRDREHHEQVVDEQPAAELGAGAE